MNEINYSYNLNAPPSLRGSGKSQPDSGSIVEAHYSDNMKVQRPRISPEAIKITIPEQKNIYSDKEATRKVQELNSDIYINQQKEKSNHDFNFKTYLKVIAAFLLAAAGIAGIRGILKFFRGKK